MGNAESVPVVSQVISAVKVVQGDIDGALRTQDEFSRKCLIVAPVRAAIEVGLGDIAAAQATSVACAMNLSDACDTVPVIGHAKARFHRACGDVVDAEKAERAVSLTTELAKQTTELAKQASLNAGRHAEIVSCVIGCCGGTQAALAANQRAFAPRPGWTIFEGQDADVGQNEHVMLAHDLPACQVHAEEKGFGGFAVLGGIARYRSARGLDLRNRLHTVPLGHLVTFYLYCKNDDSGRCPCYLPNTAFRSVDKRLVLAQNLKKGDMVLGCGGIRVQVANVNKHDKQKYKLVELTTSQCNFKTSADHRIVVPAGEKLARDLQLEDCILVGSKQRQLTKVRPYEERTELFEVTFDPDLPVEGLMVPIWGVQTKGEPYPETKAEPYHLLTPEVLSSIPEAALLRACPTHYED